MTENEGLLYMKRSVTQTAERALAHMGQREARRVIRAHLLRLTTARQTPVRAIDFWVSVLARVMGATAIRGAQ